MNVKKAISKFHDCVFDNLCFLFSFLFVDTDSCHVNFEDVHTKSQAEAKALIITEDINKHFKKPMKLEYEKLYSKYFILTKKRYIAYCKDDDGTITSKIEKGVLSKRRDNCLFARMLYQDSVKQIMDGVNKNIIINNILDKINLMFQRQITLNFFIISKMLNAEYKSKPAHAVLGETMKKRGCLISAGTRIEYIYANYKQGQKNIKQAEKLEDIEYYKSWSNYIHLDYLYYLDKFVKPIDEIFEIGLKESNFLKTIYQTHFHKSLINQKIKQLFNSRFEIID